MDEVLLSAAARTLLPRPAYRALRGVYRRIASDRNANNALHKVGRRQKDAIFVEIGANDGVSADPLRSFVLEYGWRGVFVEPVPDVFARLIENYRGISGVFFENAAIGALDGNLPFYRVRPRPGQEWTDRLNSFHKEVILSHETEAPGVSDVVEEITVPVLSFGSLLRKHGLRSVDVLLIDTEGYDYEVLKTVDFRQFRPEVVMYEHKHLSPSDRLAAEDLLRSAGYKLRPEGRSDTFGVRAA